MIFLAFVFALAFSLRFPWILATRVLIPLGLPRFAHGWIRHTADVSVKLDHPGGAAVAAAWALARQETLDEETAAWLEAELAKSAPLRGAGIFAAALLLAARGDTDGARQLIESLRHLDPRACPPLIRRLAAAWLATDAAARGEWLRAAQLGVTLKEGGREAWLLSGVAQCLLLEPMAPGRLGLWMRWALAPHRRATLPIVRRALDALDGVFIEPDDEAPSRVVTETIEGDPWSSALLLHASVLSKQGAPVTADELRTLGHAWDAVLGDKATERAVAARALTIGASGASAALLRLRQSVEDDLAALVLASGLPLADLGPQGGMADRLRVRVRERLLSEVELSSDAIRRRCDEQRPLPAIDEWREWIRLVAQYERGVRLCGPDFRRLAFYKVHPDACSLAVWLFNDRAQRPLGNAIFRWLLEEARAVDDARAVALQAKNLACGI
jgi:hypothetical protein